MLFAKAVLLRSPPPHCGCFAHNGRSALYSFVCSVSGVRALRFRIIRTCAPLNFRNIFRVAFLLSCHIFDCIGISDACLAGCPCCLFSAATLIFYISSLWLSSTFLSLFRNRQALKFVCARLSYSGECYDITSLSQMQALFNKILRILFSLERKS